MSSTDIISPRLQERLALYGVGVQVTQPAAVTTVGTATVPSVSSHPPSTSARHRSLVALHDFPAGAIILQSTPYSFALTPLPGLAADTDPSGPRRRCEWCGHHAGDVYRLGTTVAKLMRCARCHTSEYCSTSCQKAAWKQFHSYECKHLWASQPAARMLAQLAPDAQLDLLLLGRCIRRRMKEEAARGDTKDDPELSAQWQLEQAGAPLASGLDELCHMESHAAFVQQCVDQHGSGGGSKADKHKKSNADAAAAPVPPLADDVVLGMAQRLSDNTQLLSFGFRLGLFGPGVGPEHVSSLLLPTLFAFQSNNFAVSNALLLTEGAGVYPLGAILNHACEPNCAIVYEERAGGERRDRRGAEWNAGAPQEVLADPLAPASATASKYPASAHHIQTIRTLRPVRAGEELTHSYIDTASVTSKRQAHLWERYYFTCQCSRCRAASSDPTELEHFLERDIEGNQLPEDLLSYATESEPTLSRGEESIPPSRRQALLRANRLWHQATEVHMQPNTASSSSEAYEAEESRRCRVEQSLISQALSIRLQHLHPYSLPLLSTYSKLLHACLLNGDYVTGIHACEQLCAKYRVVYGSRQIRAAALARVEARRGAGSDADTGAAEDDTSAEEPAHVASHADLTPHALLGLQLYTLAALYAQTQDSHAALMTFRAARNILQLTHGAHHPLMHKLDDEMRAVRGNKPQVALD